MTIQEAKALKVGDTVTLLNRDGGITGVVGAVTEADEDGFSVRWDDGSIKEYWYDEARIDADLARIRVAT